MTDNFFSLPEAILVAPIALVVVDRQDTLIAVNDTAKHAGFAVGEPLGGYVNTNPSFEQPVAAFYETTLFRLPGCEKWYRVTEVDSGDHRYIWLDDQSEQIALAEKVKRARDPESGKVRQINHQVSTALGYAELLSVIMEDIDNLSADKMSAVSQYQEEVRRSLVQIQKITTQVRAVPEASEASILVAEGHQALAELITELLRAEDYKVTCFTDGESAEKFFRLNRHVIRQAVVDEKLMNESGVALISVLTKLAPEVRVLRLSDSPAENSPDTILKPLDFDRLLRAIGPEPG